MLTMKQFINRIVSKIELQVLKLGLKLVVLLKHNNYVRAGT